MDRPVVLGALLLVVVLANVSFSQAQTVEKYFKVGGTLKLSPQPISGAITSIVWKYDKNLLAEWVKGAIDLTYYSKFKGRTNLTTDTGVLEIGDMTATDTGVYSVEINNQVQSRVYQTVEVEDVPQPGVEVKPLACNSASPDCKLVCEGDVRKAGPVEYFWKNDDGEWEKSQINTLDISNDEETKRVKTFSCRIKNLFSEKDSKGLENPFYQEETTTEASSLEPWAIVLIVLVVVAVVVLPLVLYFTCEPFKNKVDLLCKKPEDAANTANTANTANATNLSDVVTVGNGEHEPLNKDQTTQQ